MTIFCRQGFWEILLTLTMVCRILEIYILVNNYEVLTGLSGSLFSEPQGIKLNLRAAHLTYP